MSAARYWQTLRHLRASQIFGRVWFLAYQPAPDSRPAPRRRAVARPWQSPEWREPSQLGPDTVSLLNVSARINDWNDAAHGHLWRFHLHYFDDLVARGADGRRQWHESLVARWIRENPPAAGAGWAPYPTALRMANWIKWRTATRPGPDEADTAVLDSLATQARWLSGRLEFHLMGNHLWANAKGLVFAGVFFEGTEADRWRQRGLEILSRELDEQILEDGGHFERSPMYHAILLEDVLDLVQASRVFPGVLPADFVTRLCAGATRMLRWLRVMSHPDGDVAFFNDAAFGVAAPWAALARYAEALNVEVGRDPLLPVEALAASGYLRLQNDRAVVLCDVAPIGPDYQPAHAHADTLSFELSVDGRRVIVNGGTSTYAAGPERDQQRGTAAHNTVEVDGWNSSDVWGAFRVARRARPFAVRWGSEGSRQWAEGAHDGYRYRAGRVVHRRRWSLDAGCLTVTDGLEGRFERAIARFMLHPDVASREARTVTFHCDPDSPITETPSAWHPEFGRSLDTQTVEITMIGADLATRVRWA